MHTPHPTSAMTSQHGQPLALQAMALKVHVEDACALIEQTQCWHNSEAVNIEAVYRFPLPVQASLLGVTVTLNDRLIVAEVAESRQAEQVYEQAMLDGNTAMLLEQVEPGLYTLNLGNLLADDKARVCIRYALPLNWEGRQMRLALPTTIAPRFGNPAAAGLQPHQVPQADILIEHTYSLELVLRGDLARAGISSPSHAISLSVADNQCRVSFAQGAAHADRDLVILLTSVTQPSASARLASAGQTDLLHAAFPIPTDEQPHPLSLKVLVDCSGSMTGDSIELARRATQRALAQLKPGDQYAVSAFGTHLVHAPSNPTQMQTLGAEGLDPQSLRFVRQLQANLGGTSMVPALAGVFALSAQNDESADVLLVTDGETWERDTIVRLCRSSRHRVFVMGCGACPAESVVREIAEATGGAAVFVSPSEDVNAVVDRHLQRMRQPRVRSATLSLAGSLWQAPTDLSRCTFAGSTLHVFAALPAAISGPLQLDITYADGRLLTLDSTITACRPELAADVVRIGIAAHIRESLFGTDNPDTAELTRLAVEHQLISPYTHYVMVEQRGAGAATDNPELRQIPGMLAAGWGGSGVTHSKSYLDMPMFLRRGDVEAIDTNQSLVSYEPVEMRLSSQVLSEKSSGLDDLDYLDLPAFLRRVASDTPAENENKVANHSATTGSPARLIKYLNGAASQLSGNELPLRSFTQLAALCDPVDPLLDPAIRNAFDDLAHAGWAEPQVLLAFWQALLEHWDLDHLFSQAQKTAIQQALNSEQVPLSLRRFFETALIQCSAEQWAWKPDLEHPQPGSAARVNG